MKKLTHIFFVLIMLVVSSQPVLARQNEIILSENEVREIVLNTVDVLEHDYLFPDKAKDVAQDLLHKLDIGAFDQSYPFGMFKQILENILIKATNDSGFELVEREIHNPLKNKLTRQESNAIQVDMLENDIGYIRFDGDFLFSSAQNELDSAMAYLAESRALIIDLRITGLGTLPLAQQLISFFVAPDTVIADVFLNPEEAPAKIIIQDNFINAQRFYDTPVYVLNSGFVVGPWEFVGYTLKYHHAAVIVGEDTMGVALMKKTLPVSQHANLILTYAQTHHPKTNENWQDYGVIADYQVSAQESLKTAINLATTEISR
ncbi:S41 family peptidase [Alteromonas sp. ASW11-130]|uniref:S41 family peptidase n=1 Tax=Alteromonas sp. ASW11-130 TaxID=3015775 RepID=UPI0022421970|nr:S41 family peptidase [Alteromonas sp. ASW11-130]MCW8091503.1 S41 family peptidase [Alteromonas sp. ASW11-130]